MADKPIRISGHARFEMKRRGIGLAQVRATIRTPGQIVPSVKGRQIYQARIGRAGRMLLRVIVEEDDRVIRVVTAYKTTTVDKYWRRP